MRCPQAVAFVSSPAETFRSGMGPKSLSEERGLYRVLDLPEDQPGGSRHGWDHDSRLAGFGPLSCPRVWRAPALCIGMMSSAWRRRSCADRWPGA